MTFKVWIAQLITTCTNLYANKTSAGFSCINQYWFILSLRVKLIISRWKHIFIKPYIMSFCTNKEGNLLHKGIGRNVWTKQNDKLYSYNVKARNSRLRNQKHWQFQRQLVILELNDLSSNVCFSDLTLITLLFCVYILDYLTHRVNLRYCYHLPTVVCRPWT